MQTRKTSSPNARSSPGPFASHIIGSWLAPFGITCFGAALVSYLWSRSGELLVDFGRELYVFQQVSQGRLLYQDIAYRFGPLPAFVNALWMSLFGSGIQTILVANLIVLAAACAVLYVLLLKMSDRFSATVAMLFFLVMFALGTGTPLVQYNFITPYNHGAIYGFLFSISAILLVGRFARTRNWRDAAGAGFFVGLCFLCKPELFLASAAGVVAGLAAIALRNRNFRPLLAAGSAMATPVLTTFLALSASMPWRVALDGTLGGAQHVGDKQVGQSEFYRHYMGTDHLRDNLLHMLASAAAYLALIGLLAAVARLLRDRPRFALGTGLLVAGIFAAIICFDTRDDLLIMTNTDRGLPVAMAAALALFGLRLWRVDQSSQSAIAVSLLLRFSFAVFSFVLLFKILFNVHAYHYGFVLAAPAALTGVICLVYVIPRHIGASNAGAMFFRIAAVGLFASIGVHRLALTRVILESRTAQAPLAPGGTIRVSRQDVAAISILKALSGDKYIPLTATLAVFPDSAGLNYACNRPSSIRFNVFAPFEVDMTGEPTIVKALADSPPDFIAIVETDESDSGKKAFGTDFGVAIKQWIDQNYELFFMAPAPNADSSDIRRIAIFKPRR